MQKNEKSLKDQYIEMQQRAFIREVDEEVRAEKAAIIWNKYKYYIITAIVIILAITIGHTTYENNKRETSLKQAEVFEHIMSNPSISVISLSTGKSPSIHALFLLCPGIWKG